MPQIQVKTVTRTNQALHRLRQLMQIVHDEVGRRAYYLSLQKGCLEGHELADWLQAEREVLCCPPSELAETKDEIRIKAAVPGFDSRSLQVDVLPNSLTIEGKLEAAEHSSDENIHFSEFGEKRLLRQFELPARIDPDEVTATLNEGMLRIAAKKAAVAITPVVKEVKIMRRAAA